MDLYKFTGMRMVNNVWEETPLETGFAYSVADFEPYNREVTEDLRKSLFIQPELLAGSDYSGGALQMSNSKSFLEKFGDVEGVYELWGGMGTYGVAIRLDVYEDITEIKETLDGLDEYPVIDEEALSVLENEWDCEAMNDVVSDLCNRIDLEQYIPDYETYLENSDKIEEYAWDAVNNLGIEFTHENNSSYLNYEEVKPYVEDRLLIEHCDKLPLLINREWACEENHQRYIEKFSK